ncbi:MULTISPECIES: hypothetical protein [unclassified Microbacterium]|uniref:hypothetical protein n=1 Tax=unclassified Microbacterium TaxID=2609290 RepID=UPI0034660613
MGTVQRLDEGKLASSQLSDDRLCDVGTLVVRRARSAEQPDRLVDVDDVHVQVSELAREMGELDAVDAFTDDLIDVTDVGLR